MHIDDEQNRWLPPQPRPLAMMSSTADQGAAAEVGTLTAEAVSFALGGRPIDTGTAEVVQVCVFEWPSPDDRPPL